MIPVAININAALPPTAPPRMAPKRWLGWACAVEVDVETGSVECLEAGLEAAGADCK